MRIIARIYIIISRRPLPVSKAEAKSIFAKVRETRQRPTPRSEAGAVDFKKKEFWKKFCDV